jgi:hypothetical protein
MKGDLSRSGALVRRGKKLSLYRTAVRVEDTIQGAEKSNDRIYTASDTLDHINSDLGPGSCG